MKIKITDLTKSTRNGAHAKPLTVEELAETEGGRRRRRYRRRRRRRTRR